MGALVAEGVRLLFFSVIPVGHGGLVERRLVVLYVFLFYHFFVGPTGFRWRALYGDEVYPEGYEIHGIDISHYQGKIDWEQLKNAMIKGCPVRFVIIKSTEGSSTPG